nr:TaqI-like C-terminal specificity domain-containing protein [Halovivax limisalsi]
MDQDEVRDTYEEIRDLWKEKKGRVEDYNEAQLERNFIRPIFEILDVPFEIEETVMRNARRPDYGFFPSADSADAAFDRDDFYAEAVAVADAKRWGRKLDTRGEEKRDFENPSYQIHAYLQETPVQWAVLTNGKQWRLYYGPTSHRLDSYFEIDLPEILQYVEEEGELEDFKDFYLFFRQQAFLPDQSGDCFLDNVYDESSVFAEAIGEDLQDNIYEAIRVLAEGFLDSNDDLGEDDLPLVHDSSLIYLYRLIFVLYAESEGRDLLPTDNEIYSEGYSLNELKQMVADNRDETKRHYQNWQTKLWDRLEELFVLIDQGSQGENIPKDQLYIPAYNGGLFRTNPDPDDSEEAQFLATHEADDAHLAEVIDLLTRRDSDEGDGQVFVDYSSLDERHLGSIYEGLLEYKLDVADEPLTVEDGEYSPADGDDDIAVAEGDVYLRTDAGERKATGSYYTPEYVVEYIVDETLGPLVDDIREELVGTESYHEGGFAGEFAERVFDLKVLDPAMGSGHFLVNGVDYLAREIIDAQERQDQQAVKRGDEDAISDPRTEEGELRDINWARRKVAQRCIYGVDLNPLATELAKVSLWLRTLAAEQPLAFLDHHLKTGNSLVGSDIEDVLSNDNDGAQSGQTRLSDWLDQARQRAIEHVMERFADLLSIDNETLEDIKQMEEVYEEVRDDPLYQHLLAMANVHTSAHFDLDVPQDAEEQMAEALRDGSWSKIENEDWFQSAQDIAEEESFFHWELEFPVAFYDNEGERKSDAGFDAVIGNPPYVFIDSIPEHHRDYYRKVSATWDYRYDLYGLFTEYGMELTKRGGEFGYIIPHSLLNNNSFGALRHYLIDRSNEIDVIDFTEPVFEDASNETMILRIRRSDTKSNTPILRGALIETSELAVVEKYLTEFPASAIENLPGNPFVVRGGEWIWKLIETDETRFLGELVDTVQGLRTGNNTKRLSDSKEDGRYRKAIAGEDIDRYVCDWSGTWVMYDRDILSKDPAARPREPKFWEAERKILVQEIRNVHLDQRIVAAIDNHKHIGLNTTNAIILEDESLSLDYLMGILSSNLINEFFRACFVDNHIATQYLEAIPIPTLNVQNQETPEQLSTGIDQIKETGDFTEVQTYLRENNPLRAGDDAAHAIISELSSLISEMANDRHSLNLSLIDYLGNYAEGPKLPNIGQFQPTSPNILDATTDEYEKLQVENVHAKRDGHAVTIEATARYKPKNDEAFETDQWGYTETEYFDAFTLTDLTDEEAVLVEAFVPVAVEEEIGGFRDNATKTNSLIDRLKDIMLPDIDDVQDDLEHYIKNKDRAEELDGKIEKTNHLIDEIVYDLYNLTDEEIEIVEGAASSE